MKRKIYLAVWVLLITMSVGQTIYSQPEMPKEGISANIPEDVKKEIEALYSSDHNKQADAILELKKMGENAAPAITYLISMFNNCWTVQVKSGSPSFMVYHNTHVCELSSSALGSIGNQAVDPLIEALKDINDPRAYAASALGVIKDVKAVEPLIQAIRFGLKHDSTNWSRMKAAQALEKITGEKFEDNPDKWEDWWRKNKENFQKADNN